MCIRKLIAPEQTGRTGRAVDYRAGLYALGATIYQLAWGAGRSAMGVPTAIDALDGALYEAFTNMKASDKRVLIALDVSGSMGSPIM